MEKKKIDRRKFLKTFGVGAAAATAGLYGCKTKGTAPSAAAAGEVPTDRMTFRTCPSTGDRVSLLGYGCMRWPLLDSPAADGNPIDQEAVNELVDYAIAHGVNYFDTAPVYIQGFSEKSTGIALKRHPREKVFIATKMSNHRMAGRGMSPARIFKDSEEMYRRSLRDLQTDYLDYYLLHAVGGDKGIETFNERFIDCGVLDFLLREREAGRIRNLGWSFHGDQKVFDHLLAMHDSGEARWDFVQIQMNYVDWKHASDRNVNAEYLYGELEKRGIPAVIMEPLLGGRLSRLNDHLVERLKERRPTESTASWAFRYAGSWPGVLTVLSGMTYMEHLQDNIRTYSPLTLAYIGDGIYDLIIRSIIVGKGNTKASRLHQETSKLVRAQAQSEMIDLLLPYLSEEETDIYRRGRNAKSPTMAKNATMTDYRKATGFEALMGYLYLKDEFERMVELIKIALGEEEEGKEQTF